MVAVASPVGSDVAGEPWRVSSRVSASRSSALGKTRRVVVSSSPTWPRGGSAALHLGAPCSAAGGAWPAARLLAPLPIARAVVGPRVRLPASTYRRRRAVAAGLVVGLVLVVWAALGVFGGGPLLVPEHPNSGGSRLVPGATYVVQPGDTLWSIAERMRPDGDPRPVVDRLVAGHGGGSTLYVGEQLRLPA